MTSSFPKSLETIDGAAETCASLVSAATDGNFTIQVFVAGELAAGLQAADATAVPFSLNARQMNAWYDYGDGDGVALTNAFFNSQGLDALPCGNTGAQMGGWYRKEIITLDDLKMRIGGFAGMVMAPLGVGPGRSPPATFIPALKRAPSPLPNGSAPMTTKSRARSRSRDNPARRSTRLTVAGETPVCSALCFPQRRWRRRAMTTASSA